MTEESWSEEYYSGWSRTGGDGAGDGTEPGAEAEAAGAEAGLATAATRRALNTDADYSDLDSIDTAFASIEKDSLNDAGAGADDDFATVMSKKEEGGEAATAGAEEGDIDYGALDGLGVDDDFATMVKVDE